MATSEPGNAGTVTSADGTAIAYERAGAGPAVVLVDCAGHYRELSSFDGLIGPLAQHFTVYQYDRRGRGGSGDTLPYAVEREVEDLAALIELAGGSAQLYAVSSGGLLALHAAARGLAIGGMALLEPPIDTNEDPAAQAAFTAELSRRVAAGHPGDAVEYFLTSCGVPDEIVTGMRADGAWSAMEKIAHTLVYDAMISEAITRPLLASVTVPTLVLDSQGSPDDLTGMAATVAAWLPNSSHQSLAGAWHGVADDILAPVLTAFFRR
jgi:alpha-beta hydrolase superfamily lysophospholipase